MKRFAAIFGGAAATIAVATAASRLVGFLRWLAQSAFVGSSATAGAYASANQIPNIIFEIVVGGALAGVTVPLLSQHVSRGLKAETNRIASALLTWVVGLLTLVAVAVWAGAPLIATLIPVPIGTHGPSQVELLTVFIRIFAWQIPLYGVGLVLTGVLQAHQRFLWPALVPLFSSLVVISTFALYAYLLHGDTVADLEDAVNVLGWGTTLGVAALSLPLLVPTYRVGVRLRPQWRLTVAEAKCALRLGASGLGALVAQQVSVIAGLWLLRRFGQGGTVAVFQYLQAVYWLPYALLAYPIATAAFPTLAAAGSDGPTVRFQHHAANLLTRISVVSLAGAVLLIAVAPSAQAFFTVLTPVAGMGPALALMGPALVGYSLIFVGQRILYSIVDSRAAGIVGISAWLTVTVAIILIGLTPRVEPLHSWHEAAPGPYALIALAGAHTAGMSVGAVVTVMQIRRAVGIAALRGVGLWVGRFLWRLGLAGAVGLPVNWWLTGRLVGPWWQAVLWCALAATISAAMVFGSVFSLSGRCWRATRLDVT